MKQLPESNMGGIRITMRWDAYLKLTPLVQSKPSHIKQLTTKLFIL